MQSIIYDVAVSIDGYIAGHSGDISQFAHNGSVVEDYQQRLETYATAIMGRKTYEFGYRFGMKPGENPYGHMRTLVFSNTIELPKESAVKIVRAFCIDDIRSLKETSSGPIYLCGGGRFANSLLKMGLIDRLRLKRAPILLGGGTPIFEQFEGHVSLRKVHSKIYECGYLFQEFELNTQN